MIAPSPVLAEIAWPYLVLAGLALVLLLSWPPFRRLVRKANLAAAEGDVATSLDALLALQASRLPAAVLNRLVLRGHHEAIIANRFYMLHDSDEAIRWCERGLKIARKPKFIAQLHHQSALVHAQRGDVELMERHLASLRHVQERSHVREIVHNATALWCNRDTGRLHEAERIIQEGLFAHPEEVSALLVHHVLWTLLSLGRFEEVLALAGWMLNTKPTGERGKTLSVPGDAALGLDRMRRSHDSIIRLESTFAGLEAAARIHRWDLYQALLQCAEQEEIAPIPMRAAVLAYRARLWARDGVVSEVIACAESVYEIIAKYPRDLQLRSLGRELMAKAWQELGQHERALAELEPLGSTPMSPIDRSEVAAVAATSLDALGRCAEADARRAEARKLAPLACWNQPPDAGAGPESTRSAVGLFSWMSALARDDLSRLPVDRPVKPVASGLASAAWILTPLALVPLVGALPAIALLTISILLLVRRQPLLHDRRVGAAGLTIALAALMFATVILVNFLVVSLRRADRADFAFATPVLATWPSTQPTTRDTSLETVTATTSAPFDGLELDEEEGDWGDEQADLEEEPGRFEEDAEQLRASEDAPIPAGQKILFLGVLVISIMLHEIAHAVAALWAGDRTAHDQRRFSLNPIRHVDLLGSIIIPIMLTLMPGGVVIGWAKPVPIQPRRFRHQRRGLLGVTLAGVSINLLIALAAADILCVLLILLKWWAPGVEATGFLHPMAPIEVVNVPGATLWAAGLGLCKVAIWINAILAGFNLLPLPPLDGFGVLRAVAPRPLAALLTKLSGLGMIVLLCLIAFRALSILLLPAVLLAMALTAVAVGLAGWF